MNNLSAKLDSLRKEFLKESGLNSYFEINNGDCYEFSECIYLDGLNKEYNLFEIGTDELYKLDENNEIIDGVFDEELIIHHTKNSIPLGLTIEQINRLELVPHVFITDNNKYYDAECIEGVDSFLELPLYIREFHVLKKYLEHNNLIKEGAIISSNLDLIDKFNSWKEGFFNNTGEFKSSQVFWEYHYPELFA